MKIEKENEWPKQKYLEMVSHTEWMNEDWIAREMYEGRVDWSRWKWSLWLYELIIFKREVRYNKEKKAIDEECKGREEATRFARIVRRYNKLFV